MGKNNPNSLLAIPLYPVLHVSALFSALQREALKRGTPVYWTEYLTQSETPGSPLLASRERKLPGKGCPVPERVAHLPHVHRPSSTGQLVAQIYLPLSRNKKSVHPHHPAPQGCLTWVSSPPETLNHLALLQLRKTDKPAGTGRGQHFWNVSLTDSEETAKSHLHSPSSLHQKEELN